MGFIISDTMSSERKKENFSVPKFLPETIITLCITLPQEDQEVLFYLIACSLKALSMENNQGNSSRRDGKNSGFHSASFDCSCFECYVGFWGRWNGSPNRDVIHEAIEMFEDHMARIGRVSERGRNGKKMKAKEEKLHAKELITWLGSNSDLGPENSVFGRQGKQENYVFGRQGKQENSVFGRQGKRIVSSGQTSDYVGKVEKSMPRVKKSLYKVGLDGSYMKRMLWDFQQRIYGLCGVL